LIVAVLVAAASGSPFVKNFERVFPERIVGGEEAGRGEFPYIVEIRRTGHYCGGSIVNENWIVTAAHCSVATISGYTVVAGEHRLDGSEGSEQSRTVAAITNHPDYSSSTIANDVSVWRVSTPFVFDQFVSAVNLGTADPVGDVIVAGWGTLSSGGGSPSVLMKVVVPMVTDASCKESYGSGAIYPGMICAGREGKDSCQGDSGGPLVQGNSLHGIVSWGRGCALAGYPGVYTSSAYFRSWILANAA